MWNAGKLFRSFYAGLIFVYHNHGYEFRKLPFAKSLRIGATIYNIFSKKYDANGAAATCLKSDGHGGVVAYQDDDWNSYAVFSAQAPAHFILHLSLDF